METYMPLARSLRAPYTGMPRPWPRAPASPEEMASIWLQPAGTELVLDVIASLGHLKPQAPICRYVR